MSDKTSELNVDVVAIAYYLYRQAGSPHGDTFVGFDSWYKINIVGEFEKFSRRVTE